MDNKQRLLIIQALHKINKFCNSDKSHCNKKNGTPLACTFFLIKYLHIRDLIIR